MISDIQGFTSSPSFLNSVSLTVECNFHMVLPRTIYCLNLLNVDGTADLFRESTLFRSLKLSLSCPDAKPVQTCLVLDVRRRRLCVIQSLNQQHHHRGVTSRRDPIVHGRGL
jgi:hypothetical protein